MSNSRGARENVNQQQDLTFTAVDETEKDDIRQMRFRSSISGSPSESEVSITVQTANPEQERMTEFFDQRRAERMRGAGTHAISQRQVSFPAAAAASSSSSVNTPASNKRTTSLLAARPTSFLSSNRPLSSSPAGSMIGIDQRRQERARGAATHAIESRNVNFPNQSPASTSSIASTSKVIKPPFSIAELQRRRQERMRGSGKHAIERQEVEFPNQSPVSTLRAPSEARSESSTSTMSYVPEIQTQPPRSQVESPALSLPTTGKAFEDSSFAVPLIRSQGRPRKYMKPAKPQESKLDRDARSIRDTLDELQSNLSTSIIPDLEQRKMERVRGSGTHAIERQQVQFPNPSPASSSILETSQMQTSDPSFRPILHAGRAPLQAAQTPASSSVVDRSEMPTSEPSIFVPNIDQRKQQRVRGAATHAIEPQRVQFPNQSPSSSSVLDRTEMPLSEPSVIVPDIEQRRRERVKGAGVHPVQARTVGFPEQSPASTIQTTLMNDTSQFDNSLLDPALMDANSFGEYQIAQPEDEMMMIGEEDNEITLQPEEDQTIVEEPKESTPRGKRKRSSKEKEIEVSRETSITTEGSISKSTGRKRLRPPHEIDPKLRRAIDAPVPLWHNPRSFLTNEEKIEAQMQLADIMELCIRKGTSGSTKTVGPSDADVIYTLIKREFQKVARSIPKQKRPFLSEVLDELVVHFRALSQSFTTRHQLIKDLRLAQEKKISMRRIVHEQRGNVVEALRSIDGLRQQQERKIFKSKNDRRIASFLTDMRERYAPMWN